LAHLLRETAKELPHPTDKGRSLWDATNDDGKLFGLMGHGNVSAKEEVKVIRAMELAKADNIDVSPLGSGSDYTVFLQRNGVGSMTKSDLIVDDNMVFVALDTQCRSWIHLLPS
jgi:N-acetylated-alpha-linked acidic dipeptidase